MKLNRIFSIGLLISTFSLLGQEIEHVHSIQHAFIENKGQWHEDVLFHARIRGGNMWIQQHKFLYHLQDFSALEAAHREQKTAGTSIPQTVLHVNFPGSKEVSNIERLHPTEAYYNYFVGNEPEKWASKVHGYGEAVLHDFYTGIDLKLIEQETELKYEFVVHPGNDPSVIKMEYAGHEKVFLDKDGRLHIKTALGEIIEEKPYAYQIVNGKIQEVKCVFDINDKEQVSFKLGAFHPFADLIIDPVLVFATYSGSVTDNFGMTATYGYDGTAYSGGMIYGNAYPTPDPNAYDVTSNFTVATNGTYGITDVFISKYSPDGTNMIWTTFLGGGDGTQGTETAHSMICDQNNNLYIYGATSSTDFPIVGGYQVNHAGGVSGSNFYFNGVYYSNQGTDIYVAKISANGQNLMSSTYLGGTSNDGVNYKLSSGTYNNVAAYDSLTLNYGDQFRGEIMLDSVDNVLVASCSRSIDFPVLNAFQASNAGQQDGVIFRLSNNLSTLHWSSYYGGSNNDACYSVKVDSSGNVLIAGGTSSTDLSGLSGGWQGTYNGGKADGFVLKLTPDGSSITNGSYLGTAYYDQAFFVEIDRNDNVFVLGQAAGGTFPVVNAGFVNPGSSQFVVKLNPTLTAPLNSTVFGNGTPNINISPAAFLVDICGNIYISGWGANILQAVPLSAMPITPDAYISTPPNGFDFYLLVLKQEMTGILYGSYLGGASAQEHVDGGTSRFDKNGVVYQSVCGGCGGHSDFPTSPGAWSSQNLSSNCNNVVFKFDFELIPNAEFTVDGNLGCAEFTVVFDNFSTDSDSYLWDFGNGDTTSVIFNPVMTYDTPGVYQVYLYVTDSICLLTDTAEITITVTDSITLTTSPDQELCVPTPIDLTAFTNGAADVFIWSENPNFNDTLNSNIYDSVFTIIPGEPTVYYVLASNAGCYEVDSVVVNYIGSMLTLSGETSICLGDQTEISASSSNPNIIFTYTWTPDSILVSTNGLPNILVNPTTTQYLYVTASSNTGCVVEDSIQIMVGDIPDNLVIASASETNVPVGSTVTLYGNPAGYSYGWAPADLVISPTSQNTEAVINESTLFTLFITDGICTKSDTVLVNAYHFVCGHPYLYIPNAFSPNGDLENDVLYVRGALIKEMEFRIYDRWGELVFESFDRDHGWDGTFRGKPMDPDVYDYYLRVICLDDEEAIIKGNITLLK